MPLHELLDNRNKSEYEGDYHILRFYAAFVAVSKGQVVDIKGPFLKFCPLAKMLYKDLKSSDDIENTIKNLVQQKIVDFGFFTARREFNITTISVPFGASEMMMYALRKKVIDAAVVVCDGAGSVMTTHADVVQSIGARMNGLFFTTLIPEVKQKLEEKKCQVLFSDACIDQFQAVKKVCEQGYKNIAVTINGFVDAEKIRDIKNLEDQFSVNIVVLVVCTTGMNVEQSKMIARHADIVWSCASGEVREIIGKKSLLQISERIPVFVLTAKGLNFVSAYSNDAQKIKELNDNDQHILLRSNKDSSIVMGDQFSCCLKKEKLPVRSKGEPCFS